MEDENCIVGVTLPLPGSLQTGTSRHRQHFMEGGARISFYSLKPNVYLPAMLILTHEGQLYFTLFTCIVSYLRYGLV